VPPRTQYIAVDGRSVAYQVFGAGEAELCIVPSYMSHLDWVWADPDVARMLRHSAARGRVVIYDPGGIGLSDPLTVMASIEERARELLRVLDAAEISRPDVVATMQGAATATYLAATRPDRVRALALLTPWVKGSDDGHDPPGIGQSVQQEWAAVIDNWGEGRSIDVMFPSLCGSPLHRRAAATLERTAGAPGTMRALAEWARDLDVTAVLPSVRAPTLVVANKHDRALPIEQARFVAATIPGARLVELDGVDASVQYEHPDTVLELMNEFFGRLGSSGDSDRMFAAVLFSDIVGSTELVSRLGDAEWHRLRQAHDVASRRAFERHGGTEVKSTGDGFLVTFPDAGRAVRCGLELVGAVAQLGLELRVGVHASEVQIAGSDITGIGVHAAARVCSLAGAGEVLISQDTRELATGGDFTFVDRGQHELRGAPGNWHLYSPAAARRPAIEQTPRLATGGDRLQQALIRRFPALGRGFARVARRVRPDLLKTRRPDG
jgi:class 3 adenylate cyclase